MEKVLYNGVIYTRNRRGNWTNNNEIVHEVLQRRLNAEWMNSIKIESLSVRKLRIEAIKCKENGDYTRAISYLVRAIELGSSYEIRGLLAILSSCYREVQMPGESLSLYERYKGQPYMLSAPFLTSIGAAYMDCGDVKTANRMVAKAFSLSDGYPDIELLNLYRRIKAAS